MPAVAFIQAADGTPALQLNGNGQGWISRGRPRFVSPHLGSHLFLPEYRRSPLFVVAARFTRILTAIDKPAAQLGMVRVVDESGDDFPYSAALFQPIRIEKQLERELFPSATA